MHQVLLYNKTEKLDVKIVVLIEAYVLVYVVVGFLLLGNGEKARRRSP